MKLHTFILCTTLLLLPPLASQLLAEEKVNPLTLSDIGGCANPMITIRGKYNLAKDGLTEFVETLAAIDTNQDGLICIPEVRKYDPSRLGAFGQMDTDLSDCVSPLEVKAFIQHNLEQAWIREHRVMDTNRDGVVEMRELQFRYRNPPPGTLSAMDIISEYDTNLDGVLTKEEYVRENIRLLKKLRKKSPTFSGIETGPMKPLGRLPIPSIAK